MSEPDNSWYGTPSATSKRKPDDASPHEETRQPRDKEAKRRRHMEAKAAKRTKSKPIVVEKMIEEEVPEPMVDLQAGFRGEGVSLRSFF